MPQEAIYSSSRPQELQPIVTDSLDQFGRERVAHFSRDLTGHKRLNSTMIYARVHDQTAADDYYTAMAHIEARLQLAPPAAESTQPVGEDERAQLLELVTCLAEPELTAEDRFGLVERMRLLLAGCASIAIVVTACDANQRDPPLPAFVSTEADTALLG